MIHDFYTFSVLVPWFAAPVFILRITIKCRSPSPLFVPSQQVFPASSRHPYLLPPSAYSHMSLAYPQVDGRSPPPLLVYAKMLAEARSEDLSFKPAYR